MILYFERIRLDASPEIVAGAGDDVSDPGGFYLTRTSGTDDLIE